MFDGVEEYCFGLHDQKCILCYEVIAALYVLSISTYEHIKDVVHYKENKFHIYYKTIDIDPYLFINCIDNFQLLFTSIDYLISLVAQHINPLLTILRRKR